MSDQFRDQMLEEARQRAWALLAAAEVAGDLGIVQGTIDRAALLPLSSQAARLATNLANATLANIEMMALILAGQYRDPVIAAILAQIQALQPAPRPRARARRRSRPVAGAVMMGATTPDMSPGSNEVLALEPPAAPVELPPAAQGAPEGDLP